MQIARVVEAKRPALPPNIHIVMGAESAMGGSSTGSNAYGLNRVAVWRRIGYLEGGVRIREQRQEHPESSTEYISYKVQVVTKATPIKTFLTLMDMQSNSSSTATSTSSSGMFWPPSIYNQHHMGFADSRHENDENYVSMVYILCVYNCMCDCMCVIYVDSIPYILYIPIPYTPHSYPIPYIYPYPIPHTRTLYPIYIYTLYPTLVPYTLYSVRSFKLLMTTQMWLG